MEAYWFSILGVLALCLLSVLLAVYSGSSKGNAFRAGDPGGRRQPALQDRPRAHE